MSVAGAGRVVLLSFVVALMAPRAAHAQPGSFELGASLVSLQFESPEHSSGITVLGTGSTLFTVANPNVYFTFFVTPRVAIEPQIGFVLVNETSGNNHVVALNGQVDYFLDSSDVSSLYFFGTAGIVSVSGLNVTPKVFGGGAGYRYLATNRLVIRFDGRLEHATEGGGTIVGFNVSLGGVFGR